MAGEILLPLKQPEPVIVPYSDVRLRRDDVYPIMIGAGATVEVVTRGICVLRPATPGLSERITVRSVLGPFLEHSRILSFQAGDRLSTWIGSADLMPRNLDRRVEVLAPVEDARLRARIATVLDALLADTRFAWELQADGGWSRIAPAPRELPVSAQEVLMRHALERAKKRR